MKDLRAEVERLVQDGYEFSPTQAISKAWDLFKSEAGAYIGYLILLGIISGILGLMPGVNFIGGFITAILGAGNYIYAHKDATGQSPRFNDFFGGTAFAVPIIVQRLITIAGVIALFSPFIFWAITIGLFEGNNFAANLMYGDTNFPVWLSISLTIIGIVAIYFSICLTFSVQFILFGGMNGWDAIVSSFRVIRKKWWSFFGFTLLLVLLNFAGALALLLGLLVTIPTSILAVYTAFVDVTNLGDSSGGIDDLLSEIGSEEDPA